MKLTPAQKNALAHHIATADGAAAPKFTTYTAGTLDELVRAGLLARGEPQIINGFNLGRPYIVTEAGRSALAK